ncbi:YpdA family putative bacillithiol disulfide reductase [Dyadobacter aurulentus]|uniref:YpdA family putative bacillithiol disulfide reductase n=1 Tax=Dyadobacter sp. UC 10 TaxID=2605428 RepID=UPI0011F1549D|nr:YpdA family putative bacillithiol disulfide reductase [Dyadobacter sp. UC 10]KAA0990021.1 YpdA family putative bacillithiol disulfide reductase [Dyadobacter sp. UC 10]
MHIYDVIVIGGGPCGLAMGVELAKNGMDYLILEKGNLTESIRNYPRRMRFFSTAENIEIGGIPFAISEVKANRNEALQYYRKVAGYYNLNFRLFVDVDRAEKQPDGTFLTYTNDGQIFQSKNVVLATGYFDVPRLLNVPGENLPHVSHYYDEPFKYSYTNVVLVGGSNSSVEAALELYRHDARVTIVHKEADFRTKVKYWLVPDVKNRVKEGRIHTRFNSVTEAIEPGRMLIRNLETGETEWLSADFVFLLVGYLPDEHLLARCGVILNPVTKVPTFNSENFETNVPGLYLCGTVMAGVFTEKIFIENGRDHAAAIADHLAGREIRIVKELIDRI